MVWLELGIVVRSEDLIEWLKRQGLVGKKYPRQCLVEFCMIVKFVLVSMVRIHRSLIMSCGLIEGSEKDLLMCIIVEGF